MSDSEQGKTWIGHARTKYPMQGMVRNEDTEGARVGTSGTMRNNGRNNAQSGWVHPDRSPH